MAVIEARSTAEAREYMVLAMPECEDVTIERTGLVKQDGRWVDQYEAVCPEQGIRRTFEFLAGEPPADSDAGLFGYDRQPSTLLDPGEWYLIALRYLRAGAGVEGRFTAERPPDLEAAQELTEWYARAWAALDEIVKFTPDDAAEVPDRAFWTQRGREVHERYRDEFARSVIVGLMTKLENTLRAYREAYGRYSR